MFTVKHIDADGNEFAIECRSYEVTKGKDGCTRIMTYDTPYRTPNEYTGLWAGKPVDFAPIGGLWSIYIMNRFGSTVSTHHMIDFDWEAQRLTGDLHGADPASQLAA